MANCEEKEETALYVADSLQEPNMSNEEQENWIQADLNELESLIIENEVWEPAMLPQGATAIGARYIRKVKPCGKHKSRLCGRGFNMIKG